MHLHICLVDLTSKERANTFFRLQGEMLAKKSQAIKEISLQYWEVQTNYNVN